VAPTLEGDVIIYHVAIDGASSIHIVVDNQDRYDTPGVYTYSCTDLIEAAPNRLAATGCSGNGPIDPGGTLMLPP
jgi:hypothetical protein